MRGGYLEVSTNLGTEQHLHFKCLALQKTQKVDIEVHHKQLQNQPARWVHSFENSNILLRNIMSYSYPGTPKLPCHTFGNQSTSNQLETHGHNPITYTQISPNFQKIPRREGDYKGVIKVYSTATIDTYQDEHKIIEDPIHHLLRLFLLTLASYL